MSRKTKDQTRQIMCSTMYLMNKKDVFIEYFQCTNAQKRIVIIEIRAPPKGRDLLRALRSLLGAPRRVFAHTGDDPYRATTAGFGWEADGHRFSKLPLVGTAQTFLSTPREGGDAH